MARELAQLTGESPDRAVSRAIEERLERERSRVRPGRAGIHEQLLRLGQECVILPLIDSRAPDEVLYGSEGLPRRTMEPRAR